MKMNIYKFIIVLLCLITVMFSFSGVDNVEHIDRKVSNKKNNINKEGEELICSVESSDLHTATNLIERFTVPYGYQRISYKEGSFGDYVRLYPIFPYGSKLLMYDGCPSNRQWMAAAVFQLPLEPYDLQQCADSIMRWYAEYYFSQQKYESIKYHFVDGSLHSWVDSKNYDGTYDSLIKFLNEVFNHANTVSLECESEAVTVDELQIGDILIRGGYPGHALMVVDVAINDKGKKAILLGQGLMPAQQFHVVNNPLHENDPWYYQDELSETFSTPGYTFSLTNFKRPIFCGCSLSETIKW